ncbi:glycoside hydrolase family 9 protein [Vibrio cincinnatiensis]|uniref:glycoside hydrolase family 9 protein n=1 Tax=Vibrio cincinnatiensis TaxID=675 RepID=UPI001EDCB4F5|nr:glycoside hydrolase family 9 protein [Vibrio cincinnatiensis]MCG3729354.1 glycosyl hydrolase [Vibrio cincinnatiensis]
MNKKRLSIVAIFSCGFIGLSGCTGNSVTPSHANKYQENLLTNGNFSQGTDGWWAAGATVQYTDEMGCITFTEKGNNSWDVILGQSGLAVKKGEDYHLQFHALAHQPTNVKTLVQHNGAPYTNHLIKDISLNQELKPFQFSFKPSNNDDNVQLQFQMGTEAPTTVCVKDIILSGPEYIKDANLATIRVNQVGYFINATKHATVATQAVSPVGWKLFDTNQNIVAEGQTIPFGLNKSSGENVQLIDFSHVKTPMTKATLEVEGNRSHPFAINDTIYSKMKYDALSFFYQQRSGIDILPEYVQRADLARPAGHQPEIVTCFNQTDAKGNSWPGCELTLDVTGGWYDAGDHGKYVVNGGISVWTLTNYYEREKQANSNRSSAFADGKVAIPENKNQFNDLLDEARWMMDFLMAMQVPENNHIWVPEGDQSNQLDNLNLTQIDASGMAFHKVADDAWTGMPLPPHKDPRDRFLSYPTTAATLNLAATAAQCARVWKELDPSYAQRCLTSAEKAWKAANQHNNIYAYDNFVGSGPYDDTELDDEFYWAAAELFTTTGKEEYKQVIQASPYYLATPKGDINATGDVYWQGVSGAGTLTLAIVPNKLPAKEIEKARANIIQTADNYYQSIANEGYRIPYTTEEYPWGSNSNLMNRSIFLGVAYDFTKNPKYVQGIIDAMDYILGRNPLDQSYVSGYGSRPLLNPHHRFWAHPVDSESPLVAPGVMSGGPNSINFSDPVASSMKGKCIGQTCWKDDIGAWTLNEITINWNAPFFWAVSFLDETVQ